VSGPGGREFTFRPLVPSDIQTISLVHRRACLIAYRFMNWSYSLPEVEAWYCRISSGWTWTLAMFDADVMMGFIAVRDLHIDQLYVDPSYQRRGIGSSLLDRALDNASGRTTLHVFEANGSARAFYEKHGFRQQDRWMNTEEGAIDLLYVREA
jgi:putative acetyltransferase